MQEQSKYKKLIESTADKLILVVENSGKIKYAEGNFSSYQIDNNYFLEKNISDVILDKESPFTQPLLNQVNQEVIALLKRENSERLTVHLKIKFDLNEQLYVFFIRPTNAHHTEKEGLEQLKEFYENLLNNLPVDVVVFSDCHKYLYINKIALSDEKKRNWIIGKTDEEYAMKYNLSESHIQGRKETFKKVIQTGNLIQYEEEFEGRQPDGSSKWVLRHFKPIYNSKSEIDFVLGFGLDISDRKKAELETLKNLEKQTELNQLKNKFVSTISHEFRTPLATIKGSIDLLQIAFEKYQINNHKIVHYIDTINNEVYNLNNLLNEVLMIGRHDINQTPVCFTKDNLFRFVENIIVQNYSYLTNRKINLIAKSPIDDIEFDPKLMFHVITNILSNAVKYSQLDIVISVFQDKDETNIHVEDFGIGIPESEQPQLFNSFYRASNSSNYQGSGLGLVIVKNFIELHHGKIEVVSKLNIGTLFKISLPNFQQSVD